MPRHRPRPAQPGCSTGSRLRGRRTPGPASRSRGTLEEGDQLVEFFGPADAVIADVRDRVAGVLEAGLDDAELGAPVDLVEGEGEDGRATFVDRFGQRAGRIVVA